MFKLFLKSAKGATSLEFAIIAPILLGLFVLIIEFCYLMYVQSSLDRAGIAAAELIRKDDKRIVSSAELRSKICGHLSLFYVCDATNVIVQVTPAGTIIPPSSTNIYTRSYSKGIADTIRIKLKWPLFTPLSSFVLSTSSTGQREMVTNITSHPEPPFLPCALTGGLVWCL
jgi:Flp pilus assembly protein TadG